MAFGEKSLFEYIFLHISWPPKGCYQQQSDMSFHLHMILFLDEYLQKSKLDDICLHLSIIFHSLFSSKTDFHSPHLWGSDFIFSLFSEEGYFSHLLPLAINLGLSHPHPKFLGKKHRLVSAPKQYCTERQSPLTSTLGPPAFYHLSLQLPGKLSKQRPVIDSRKEKELGLGSG